MKKVLVICTHNSSRSQMAEGLINGLLGDRVRAFSAGTEVTQVSPHAIRAMSEIGIDISHHMSKVVDQFIDETFDLVVTVCDSANESCPVFPGAGKRLHKGFTDPNSAPPDERYRRFCQIRDEIRTWVESELPGLLGL